MDNRSRTLENAFAIDERELKNTKAPRTIKAKRES